MPFCAITLENPDEATAVLKFLKAYRARKERLKATAGRASDVFINAEEDSVIIADKPYRLSHLSYIVETAKLRYSDRRHFSLRNIVSTMLLERPVSQRLVQDALRFGVATGQILRLSKGVYQVIDPAKEYRADPTAAVDLLSSTKTTAALYNAFRLLASYTDGINLYAGSDGLRARYWSENQLALVDAFIPKDAFAVYAVPEKTKFTIYIDELVRRIANSLGPQLHLKVIGDASICKAGWINEEHDLKVLDCVKSDAFAIEQPLPKRDPLLTVKLPTQVLRQVVNNVMLNSDRLGIKCGPEKLELLTADVASYGSFCKTFSKDQVKICGNDKFASVVDASHMSPFLVGLHQDGDLNLNLMADGLVSLHHEAMPAGITLGLYLFPILSKQDSPSREANEIVLQKSL